jgi:hypothetical protein
MIAMLGLLVFTAPVHGANRTASASGNWNSTSTWGGSSVPVAGDVVTINSGVVVTISTAATCASITINNSGATTGITLNTGGSLTVSGAITLNAPSNAGTTTVAVSSFTLSAGSIVINGGSSTNRVSQVTISTGTVTVVGDITIGGTTAQAKITFSSTGTLNIGGNLGTGGTFTANAGTVSCNGTAAQTVGGYTYNTLKSNNAAGVSLVAATTIKTLTIGDVTANSIFNDAGNTITLTSPSVLNLTSGTYNLGSATVATTWRSWGTRNIGAGTTVGYVSGLAQTVSTTPAYQNLTLGGAGVKTITGITVNGILSMEGTATATGTVGTYGAAATLRYKGSGAQVTGSEFTTPWAGTGGVKIENASGVTLNAVKTINATSSLTIGGTVANSVFNDSGFQLTSTGTLNFTSGTFKLGSATAATTFPAFAAINIVSGATVEYASGLTQTVSTAPSYKNLTISGTGTKNPATGTLSIAGNWIIGSSTALNMNNTAVSLTGNLTINSGTLTQGAAAINVGGNWVNSGTFTAGSGGVLFNGTASQSFGGSAATTFSNLTINNASGVTLSSSPIISGTLTLTSGTFTVGANTLTLNGPTISGTPANLSTTASSSLVFGGSTAGVNIPSSVTALNNMTVNNASGVTLSSSPIISGTLTLTNGKITTGSYTLSINSSGSVSRGTNGGYVVGNFQKYIPSGTPSPTFEVGAANYNPVSLTFGSVTTPGNLTVAAHTGDYSSPGINPAKDVNVYWSFVNSGIVFTSYSATFNFAAGDIDGGATYTNFIVGNYYISGWTYPTVSSRTATSTQATGLTAFGNITIGEISTYTITASAGSNGSISPLGTTTVNYNGSQTYTINPAAHYHVADVLVDSSSVGAVLSYTFSNVTANHSIAASFTIDTYTLTYTAGAHGTINGTSVQTVNYNNSGTQVTAMPNAGYDFTQWSDGVLTAARTDASVTANISVTATFTIKSYTLTYNHGTHGTITGTTPQTVNYGVNGSTVVAQPDAGYHFNSWDDGYPTATRTDLNVTANHNVTASFAINTYTLTYNHGAHGSITGTSPQTVNYGANGSTVTAQPDTGCHFNSWDDGYPTATRTDLNVTANYNVTASFAINTYTLTYNHGTHGTITGTSPQTVNYGANGSVVVAQPDAGYHFDSWDDGYPTATRTDLNVTASHTVTASFAINTYTLTYNHGAHGSITGTTPQTVNYGGNGSTVTAQPDPGYHFDSWDDGYPTATRTDINVTTNHTVTASFTINAGHIITATAGTGGSITPSGAVSVSDTGSQSFTIAADPGYTINDVVVDSVSKGPVSNYDFTNVTGDHTITVSFTINTYTLTYNHGTHGTITGTTPQTVNYGANGSAVVAQPDAGYHFDSWDDGYPTATRTDLNVTADINVTASFALNSLHTITATADSGGSISPVGAVSVTDGTNQAFSILVNPGYIISNIVVDGVSQGAVPGFTFYTVNANHTIYATFYSTGVAGSTGNTNVPANQTNVVVDASVVAQTTVTVSTNALPVGINVIKYSSNPHPETTVPVIVVPKFNDIVVSNLNAISGLVHVEISYTDAEIAGIDEQTLKMYYYQSSAWNVCSSTGVNAAGNIVWADMTAAELAGSPLMFGGGPIVPVTAVGGTVFPVDKLQILMPWLILAGLITLFTGSGALCLVRIRRRKS